jgi:hypothetical protein
MRTLSSALKRHVFPTVLALSLAVVAGAAPTTASAAAGGISIIGGDAAASVVCGNVAAAKDLAVQRGIVLQKSDCTADSAGGNVALENVDIFISAAARSASRMNAALADLASGATSARVATDVCKPIKSSPSRSQVVQRNICWGKGFGGRAQVKGAVVGLVQHPDGTVTRRTFSAASLPHDPGSATANCTNIVGQPEHQQDRCSSSGGGASFLLRDVTVVEHRSDGSSKTKPNIDVTVRGGRATSNTYCFNVADGSGRIVQVNHCTGTATGGNVTLSNVTVHTTA